MLCALGGGIGIRLLYLQVTHSSFFLSKSTNNFLRREHITPQRGDIVDCHGALMATNRAVTDIWWQGTGNKTLDAHQLQNLDTLTLLFGQRSVDVATINRTERYKRRLLLYHDVSFQSLAGLLEKIPNSANIITKQSSRRHYPLGSCACHIVGYLSYFNQTSSGLMGLEKLFDEVLRGTPGELLRTINSVGSNLGEAEVRQALSGATLSTTIDLELQKIAERVFPEGKSGSIIIMHPYTGALLAVVSRPFFDPNLFLDPIDDETWKNLQAKKNHLSIALLQPTILPHRFSKLITSAAALDLRITTSESSWFCGGHIMFAGRRYHCNNHFGHGHLNLQRGLAVSCNIPFFEIARSLRIDTLADYARRFGLGEKSCALFNERSGLMPTSKWKREVKHEPWWPGETLSAVIGQSFILITPIQAARMASAIFSGFLVKPRILLDQPNRALAISHFSINTLIPARSYAQRRARGRCLQIAHSKTMQNLCKNRNRTGCCA